MESIELISKGIETEEEPVMVDTDIMSQFNQALANINSELASISESVLKLAINQKDSVNTNESIDEGETEQ